MEVHLHSPAAVHVQSIYRLLLQYLRAHIVPTGCPPFEGVRLYYH